MTRLPTLLFLFILFSVTRGFGQINDRIIKELKAKRVDTPLKIDGKLDEEAWKDADVAKDFVEFQPGFGDSEPKGQETEVKVLYDDNALYIGAYLRNTPPNKIFKELTARDNFGSTDVFGITINPNNDGQNEFWFLVTAAGVQIDAQISPSNGEDFSWNEVWFSKVTIDENGWYVEMKLPFSALRFSKEDEYIWGLNFFRNIEERQKLYSWNPIDKTRGSSSLYTGILTGIKNIHPPVRLSFLPFVSGIYDNLADPNTKFNFGMDVKYGITDNFTLFATLIPDFSQAGFDNLVLNLGPFEQRYEEQRQFFIEGADLLNKGDLFFSRRIGGTPTEFRKVYEIADENKNLEVIDNPHEVDVINAIKVTGRTKKGLGLALLNAVTKKTEATLRDVETGEKIHVVTEPLANYSVFVIDQEFNKNSSVGFTNTNVVREGEFRDANVSALLFKLTNKANSYRLSGNGSMSVVRENGINTKGFSSNLGFSKIKGHVRFNINHNFSDAHYDKNDLGFQRRDNYNNIFSRVSYEIFEPTKRLNSFKVGLFYGYFRRFEPSVYTGTYLRLFMDATTLNQLSFSINAGTNIGQRKDFFEPRTEGRFWVKNPTAELNGGISTDRRKKFAIEFGGNYETMIDDPQYGFGIGIVPRYRFNNKIQIQYSFSYDKMQNEYGYVNTLDDGSIIFGTREVNEIVNGLSGKYSFSDRMSLVLAFRHYWSPVKYNKQFYKLEDSGELTENDYTADHDLNFNSWNIDLRYVWEVTRGSEIMALYRNSILGFDNNPDKNFQENLSDLFNEPIGHMVSIKFIYFLDYNNMRSWFKKK